MKKWEVNGFNTISVIEEMDNGGWKHICTCDYGYAEPMKHLELNKANAKKISAVPDLIDALQTLVADIKSKPNDTRYATALRIAELAIKKATE